MQQNKMEMINTEPHMELITIIDEMPILAKPVEKQKYEAHKQAVHKYRTNPANRAKIAQCSLRYYHKKMNTDPVFKAKRLVDNREKHKSAMEWRRHQQMAPGVKCTCCK